MAFNDLQTSSYLMGPAISFLLAISSKLPITSFLVICLYMDSTPFHTTYRPEFWSEHIELITILLHTLFYKSFIFFSCVIGDSMVINGTKWANFDDEDFYCVTSHEVDGSFETCSKHQFHTSWTDQTINHNLFFFMVAILAVLFKLLMFLLAFVRFCILAWLRMMQGSTLWNKES